jgi:DNA (cytosine-5)-methyltransferase 1
MMDVRFISLFAGVGGFDLGFERAGMRCVAQVESDPNCRSVLARHWPDVIRRDDVRTSGNHNLPDAHVICGGFPCQDLSVAGKRLGLAGDRSGLFYEMTRICNELRPAYIVWENVLGLLTSDDGRDFARVLMELERIGYSGAWTTLDAQFFGVAQRRRRVFGVFARQDIGAGRCAEILSFTQRMPWNPSPRRETGEEIAGTLGGGTGSRGWSSDTDRMTFIGFSTRNSWIGETVGLSPTLSMGGGGFGTPSVAATVSAKWAKGSGGWAGDEAYNLVSAPLKAASPSRRNGGSCPTDGEFVVTPLYYSHEYRQDSIYRATSRTNTQQSFATTGGVRRLTPRECERLQGWTDDWTRWGADGREMSDSVRYRMCGNGVASPVAEWLGKRLVEVIVEMGR